MPPEVEQVDDDGYQQGEQAPKQIWIKETHVVKVLVFKNGRIRKPARSDVHTVLVSEEASTHAATSDTVAREGTAGVVFSRPQRDAYANAHFDTFRKSATRDIIGVHIHGGHGFF